MRYFFCLIFLTGCYRGHLYVQQEWVDRDFYASTWVRTPDYRKAVGQRLLVSWDYPRSVFQEKLWLYATVRFWDNTEEIVNYELPRKRGTKAFFFKDRTPDRSKKILTYQVHVVNQENQIIETWNHQFWTELIDVEMSSSVSSQPKQGSVTETP